MNKKVLILGATGNQVPMVRTAKQMGLYVITMDWNIKNTAHKYSDHSVQIDIIDKNAVLNWAKKNTINGIATCASDLALQTQSFVCEKLNFNGSNPQIINQAIYKDNFREFQKKNNLLHPEFFVFSNPREAIKTIKKLKNIQVIKPVDSSGSKGLSVLDPSKNICIRELRRVVNNAFQFSYKGRIIVEKFLIGKNYTIDGFYRNGEIDHFMITSKELTKYPYRVPVGHLSPPPISNKLYEKLKTLIKNYMDKLNVITAPFDMDLIIYRGSIYMVEMSLRVGGNALPEIMLCSTGYNLHKSVLSYALNLKHNEKSTKNNLTVGRLIRSNIDGIIKNVADRDLLLNKFNPYLKELEYDVDIGEKVFKFQQGNHRLGYYIVQNKNKKQINKICQAIEREINLVVMPEK